MSLPDYQFGFFHNNTTSEGVMWNCGDFSVLVGVFPEEDEIAPELVGLKYGTLRDKIEVHSSDHRHAIFLPTLHVLPYDNIHRPMHWQLYRKSVVEYFKKRIDKGVWANWRAINFSLFTAYEGSTGFEQSDLAQMPELRFYRWGKWGMTIDGGVWQEGFFELAIEQAYDHLRYVGFSKHEAWQEALKWFKAQLPQEAVASLDEMYEWGWVYLPPSTRETYRQRVHRTAKNLGAYVGAVGQKWHGVAREAEILKDAQALVIRDHLHHIERVLDYNREQWYPCMVGMVITDHNKSRDYRITEGAFDSDTMGDWGAEDVWQFVFQTITQYGFDADKARHELTKDDSNVTYMNNAVYEAERRRMWKNAYVSMPYTQAHNNWGRG